MEYTLSTILALNRCRGQMKISSGIRPENSYYTKLPPDLLILGTDWKKSRRRWIISRKTIGISEQMPVREMPFIPESSKFSPQ